ncbi:MAG: hypothetical protein WD673_12255 [Alphaproteobacteria bacterium]
MAAPFLMGRPYHRHWVKRVPGLAGPPYVEIRDNLRSDRLEVGDGA